MDPAIKHWVGLWDYLDGNFWGVWQWAATHLGPDAVGCRQSAAGARKRGRSHSAAWLRDPGHIHQLRGLVTDLQFLD